MSVMHKVFANLYQDSVSLMQISAQIGQLPGIEQASVVMGTATNLAQLRDAGLDDGCKAGPNDLIIAVRGEATACSEALEIAHQRLNSKPQESASDGPRTPQLVSLEMAVEQQPDLNLALISVPGDYAAAEAIKALQLDMNVMLFSDNVSLEQEKQIKQLAQRKNRLVMGPDCGTAIINGLPLGFANVVNRGSIGIVGASGTGLQEVSCRIDQLGAGISQALGTGGHDLHEAIGGISMLHGLQALAADPATQVIVLISKPPARPVAERILERAQACGKPVVVNFLGAAPEAITRPGITAAATLADAAEIAVAQVKGNVVADPVTIIPPQDVQMLQQASVRLPATRRAIRGVFAGGTFCYEGQLLCQQQGFSAASNTPVAGNAKLADIWRSQGHTLIDMGDDDFTRGRPHPMIDPTLRNQRIVAELNDADTAVVLFDLVLGYGAAAEPATELLALLSQHDNQNGPVLIAHVCGTEADPQQRSRQVAALRQAGVLVAGCNAQAALWASQVAHIQAEKNGETA
ncbi:CoA binding protein [Serratia fonticola]|jgi:FdrA protein|uniref:CoA binding protein n=1 Tax=Serratia fonticola TaxID=47917 RepID=A0A559T3T7_SERFO|nr:acyl-CoA synthetase FdrA [Serratia fonticola]TQI78245.1 CoA binding protein [Serratia fonticola]TQI94757.1 CoA binding protein [Serratia fonticola]TVZ69255.1 CoA binding protein [Serratia fonticola]